MEVAGESIPGTLQHHQPTERRHGFRQREAESQLDTSVADSASSPELDSTTRGSGDGTPEAWFLPEAGVRQGSRSLRLPQLVLVPLGIALDSLLACSFHFRITSQL